MDKGVKNTNTRKYGVYFFGIFTLAYSLFILWSQYKNISILKPCNIFLLLLFSALSVYATYDILKNKQNFNKGTLFIFLCYYLIAFSVTNRLYTDGGFDQYIIDWLKINTFPFVIFCCHLAIVLLSAGSGALILWVKHQSEKPPVAIVEVHPKGDPPPPTSPKKESKTYSSMIPGFIEGILIIIVIGVLLFTFVNNFLPEFSKAVKSIGNSKTGITQLLSWMFPFICLLVAAFLVILICIYGIFYIKQTRRELKESKNKGLPDLLSFVLSIGCFLYYYINKGSFSQSSWLNKLNILDTDYLGPLLGLLINTFIFMILFTVFRVIIKCFYPPDHILPSPERVDKFWGDIKNIADLIINFAFETIEDVLGSINLLPNLISSVCSLLGIPTSRKAIQKMNKNDKIYFLSTLASVCFSVVSFLATKEGFDEYIYTDDSQSIFAVLWTIAIQLMLLIFNLKLPAFLKEQDTGKWKKCNFAIIAYCFLFIASFFMAFVHMTSAGYAATRYQDASTLFESKYRSITEKADAYRLEIREFYQNDMIDSIADFAGKTKRGANDDSTEEIRNKYYEEYLKKLNKEDLENEQSDLRIVIGLVKYFV